MPRVTWPNSAAHSSQAETTHDSVSVGTSSVEIVAANNDRVEVTICNDHASQILYLSLGGTAEANKGIRVNAAGGSYTTSAYTGAINGIATGAATVATVSEV